MKKYLYLTLTTMCTCLFWIGCDDSVSSSESYEVIINNYSSGTACGGSIMVHENQIYRSYDGGIAPLNTNLEINSLERSGYFQQSYVYHMTNYIIVLAYMNYVILNYVLGWTP